MTAGKVTPVDMRDVEAIRSLKLRYAELCDTGYDPDELTALFVDDGIFEIQKNCRRTGVDAFYHQVEIVRRTRHEVSLVFAP